jgi:hypothetical protein
MSLAISDSFRGQGERRWSQRPNPANPSSIHSAGSGSCPGKKSNNLLSVDSHISSGKAKEERGGTYNMDLVSSNGCMVREVEVESHIYNKSASSISHLPSQIVNADLTRRTSAELTLHMRTSLDLLHPDTAGRTRRRLSLHPFLVHSILFDHPDEFLQVAFPVPLFEDTLFRWGGGEEEGDEGRGEGGCTGVRWTVPSFEAEDAERVTLSSSSVSQSTYMEERKVRTQEGQIRSFSSSLRAGTATRHLTWGQNEILGSTRPHQDILTIDTEVLTTFQPILLPQSLPSQPHRDPDDLIQLLPPYSLLVSASCDRFGSFDSRSGGEGLAGLDAGEGRTQNRFD